MSLANIDLPDFNISRVWRDSYIKLMSDDRTKLGVKTSSYQLPILPRSPPSTAAGYREIRFADMVLRADEPKNKNAIKLRLRRDNLYLVGFQMQLASGNWGRWMEFTPDAGAPQLIQGSTYLGFTGGYEALLTVSRVGNLEKVSVGREALLKAVEKLNNSTATTYASFAEPLIVVLIMICESLRYRYISDTLLAPTFVNVSSSNTKPNLRTVALMKNWSYLSELLLVREQSPTNYFPSNPPPPAMEIHNYLDAVAVLGILKEETPVRSTTLLRTTINAVNDAAAAAAAPQQYNYPPHGEPMVEVIWVKIDDSVQCDHLYGTIQITDGAGSQYLYKTTRDESVKTKPGEHLILQHNPADRCILAYDSFTIDVDLKDAAHNNTSSQNSGVDIKGEISWHVFNTFSNVYDQPLQQVIKGECGSVTVNYVVLSDAVKAKLEVTLINKGDHIGAETTHVYGDLIVRIGKFKEGSVIFKKASNEPIGVTSGQLIPLLKSAVAVPLNSSLIVEANISGTGDDDGFAKCPMEFPAQLSGTSEKSISGKSGEIRVKVTWDRET